MYVVGMNVFSNALFTKNDFKRGKIPSPGTKVANVVNGDTREYVVVKLASGAWINGTVLVLEGTTGVVGTAVTASGMPAAAINQRVGVLCFASASLTLSASTTIFCFAQVYGVAQALVSGTATLPGAALGIGTGAAAFAVHAAGTSASAMLQGVTIMVSQSLATTVLTSVMLNYPTFRGPPDGNLA